ncbi:hypothetical protein KAU19_04140 [Candidatus Parcubacteria bacterium]|nr:hypothetical protein [Candidatus Parcubacteria bacterium]
MSNENKQPKKELNKEFLNRDRDLDLIMPFIIKDLNLTLVFNQTDCSGFFHYPDSKTKKASTNEILSFFILYNKG